MTYIMVTINLKIIILGLLLRNSSLINSIPNVAFQLMGNNNLK